MRAHTEYPVLLCPKCLLCRVAAKAEDALKALSNVQSAAEKGALLFSESVQ